MFILYPKKYTTQHILNKLIINLQNIQNAYKNTRKINELLEILIILFD